MKILLISDLHKLSVPVGKQKGQVLKWYEKAFEWFINIWKWWNIAYAIPKMIRKIFLMVQHGTKFDFVLVGGDVIESEYNERGMVMSVDCQMLCDMMDSIALSSGVELDKIFVVSGDHELGYRLPLSTDPSGGISDKSIGNFLNVVGPLWQAFTKGDYTFVILSSSLMMQKLDHLTAEKQEQIIKLCQEQKVFIQKTLNAIPEGRTVFVFMHDPDALIKFDEYIRDYYYMHNKNFKVFCGHMHAEWSLVAYEKLGKLAFSKLAGLLPEKIIRWAKGNNRRLMLFEKYNLQIMLAPGGMMGVGGGFLVLEVFTNGKYQINRHKG